MDDGAACLGQALVDYRVGSFRCVVADIAALHPGYGGHERYEGNGDRAQRISWSGLTGISSAVAPGNQRRLTADNVDAIVGRIDRVVLDVTIAVDVTTLLVEPANPPGVLNQEKRAFAVFRQSPESTEAIPLIHASVCEYRLEGNLH